MFSFAFLESLFSTSVVINTVIVTVFTGSVIGIFRYILSVRRDLALFDEFTVWCRDPEENSFNENEFKKGLLGPSLWPISCSIKDHGVLVLGSTSDSRSIIEGMEQSISSRTSLISFLGGFLVLLGLMGTFLGLTITLKSMGNILTELAGGLSDASDTSIMQVMIQLIVELKNPMAGMGTAFSTSLFGLSGSGIIGILAILLSRMHDQLTLRVEEWLNENIEYSATNRSGQTDSAAFPVDADITGQLAAISGQLEKNNTAMLEAIENTNKFLLKMTLLQQKSADAINVMQSQSIETTKEIGLGNELTGRLIKESRQIAVALERSVEAFDNKN
ncbi:hypothetical protein [Maridesulfovibrio sp.]|uniref:hypothetical protein n=1 Tax=Maridesulfovibrio sp. TaxID=2795000 RepID=UPI002A186F07|nr:hypothetical protein [Maridesulfovibrio sp.]